MDEEINTNQNLLADTSDEYAEALESIPVDVRTFLWSDAFSFILKAISETYKLTDAQTAAMKRVTMGIITDTSTPVSIQIELSDAGLPEEMQEKILQAIDDEIISRILVKMENEDDLAATEEEAATDKETIPSPNQSALTTPSSDEALAMIKNRLANPSIAIATKRDYSAPLVTDPVEANVGIKSIDPYREAPEK